MKKKKEKEDTHKFSFITPLFTIIFVLLSCSIYHSFTIYGEIEKEMETKES